MTTMRLDRRHAIGDVGAVYEFDVKLPILRDKCPLLSQGELENDTEIAVDEFKNILQNRYDWVGNVYLTGRSNGWLAVEDSRGEATREALVEINSLVDEAYDQFMDSLREAYSAPEVPALTSADMKRRYHFFKEHAGYMVGRRAEGAVNLARAEYMVQQLNWEYEWEEDPDGWSTLGDIDPKDVEEVLGCVLKDGSGDVVASLGGIIDPDRNYRRVVEAELALEALSEKGVL